MLLRVLQTTHGLIGASCCPAAAAAAAVVIGQHLSAQVNAFHSSNTLAESSNSSSSSSVPKTIAQKLKQLVAANEQFVPRAFHDGRPLTDAQRDNLALLKRFNVAQPYLLNQVILAKVLRATPKQLLVDPGYYGLNWVPRQVRWLVVMWCGVVCGVA